jgi:hypothetical protein
VSSLKFTSGHDDNVVQVALGNLIKQHRVNCTEGGLFTDVKYRLVKMGKSR